MSWKISAYKAPFPSSFPGWVFVFRKDQGSAANLLALLICCPPIKFIAADSFKTRNTDMDVEGAALDLNSMAEDHLVQPLVTRLIEELYKAKSPVFLELVRSHGLTTWQLAEDAKKQIARCVWRCAEDQIATLERFVKFSEDLDALRVFGLALEDRNARSVPTDDPIQQLLRQVVTDHPPNGQIGSSEG